MATGGGNPSPAASPDLDYREPSLLLSEQRRIRSSLSWSERSSLLWSQLRSNDLSWSQWLWHSTFADCCNFTRRNSNNKIPPVSLSQFLSVFLSKLLLELCGAAGAVWGFCEIMDVRHVENTDDFRPLVALTFAVFAVRFYWHAKHFWQHGYDFPYVKLHHRRSHWYHGLQVFGAKLLLQVWGAAGAVWGASESLGFRNAGNRDQWLIAARITTVVFGVRWLSELFSYCLISSCRHYNRTRQCFQVWKNRIVPFLEVTITKFVLEVCGSTGAVWGFADVLSIRDQSPDSAQFWRIVALVIGSIFLARWMVQVKVYLHSGEESPLATEPPRVELQVSTITPTESLEDDEDDEETGIVTKQQGNYGSTTATAATSNGNEIV